jgi:hypothetical protein
MSEISLRCQYFPEPLLAFANGELHIDPKAGIARYGPHSLGSPRDPRLVRIGMIGTAETTSTLMNWLLDSAEGIDGNDKHPAFPGFQDDRGFFTSLETHDGWVQRLTQTEINELTADRWTERDRFDRTVRLLDERLAMLRQQDQPPHLVMISLPDTVVRRTGSVDYHDTAHGMVHRDLRRALKATAMKYWLPTQLIDVATVNGRDKTPRSKIAWNLFTSSFR